MSQSFHTQEEDILDESDEEAKIDIEECNVVINDDDNGSVMPMSNNDIGSIGGDSTPRDDEDPPSIEDDEIIPVDISNSQFPFAQSPVK